MYEVEVKVQADLDAVRAHLHRLEAEVVDQVEQTDTYYDHPVRSFAETDEALRIRREADRAVLTYKGPKVDAASKTRREFETGVADASAADAVLQAVGFDPAATVRKTRQRFELDGFTVSLDTVDGLGTFVEVEATAAEDDIEAVREAAFDVLDRLRLDPDTQLRASYLELLADARE